MGCNLCKDGDTKDEPFVNNAANTNTNDNNTNSNQTNVNTTDRAVVATPTNQPDRDRSAAGGQSHKQKQNKQNHDKNHHNNHHSKNNKNQNQNNNSCNKNQNKNDHPAPCPVVAPAPMADDATMHWCGPVRCQRVIDGDTLTIKDIDAVPLLASLFAAEISKGEHQFRVRFHGMDTLEIKLHAPFAVEAKQRTQHFCEGKLIWLRISKNAEEAKDHYGRLIALIFTSASGEVCVNEVLVSEGLAGCYQVEDLPNRDTLLRLQKEARDAHRGIWKGFVDRDVFVSRGQKAIAYHNQQCEHFKPHFVKMKESAAIDAGKSGCRSCLNNGQ